MADDDYYMKKVKDLSYELDNVSEAFIDISRLQKGVIKGFTEITKTSTATGQAWVSVARFFSGSGFWRVQNKIKAVSNALQFMQKIEEDRNKAEQDRMKELAKNEQHMKNLASLKDKLQSIEKNTAGFVDHKSLMENKMFKLYRKEHGMKQAILMINEKIGTSLEKARDYEMEMGKIRAVNYEKRLRSEKKMGELKSFRALTREGQILKLTLEDLTQEYGMLKNILDSHTGPQEERDDIRKRMGEVQKEWSKKSTEWKDKEKKGELTQGNQLQSFWKGLTEGDTPLGEALKNFSLLKGPLKMWERVKSGWAKAFDPKTWQLMGKLMRGVIGFVAKAMIWMYGILLVLLAVKASGAIEIFKSMWEGLKVWAVDIFKAISDVINAAVAFGSALFVFIDALFNGTYEEVRDAGSKLLKTYWKLIQTFLIFTVKLVFGLFVVLYEGLKDWFVSKVFKSGQKWWQKVITVVISIMGAIGGFIAASALAASLNPVAAALAPVVGAAVGMATGAKIGQAFQGYSSGGLIPKSGSYLVGERGPELINLPAGTRVHNNSNTQHMSSGGGQTINVNVNGRVGASDAELRDIASKIGRMVNMEMNRNTHRGVRGA
ncbi:MAG TPA: hypothetical protein DF712_13535 [Balneola sp.]|nr:hypothetical protein [Balneola sp.]|tara:strand:- start:867 stop:2678 length:1812 start_codon:yes stop_codon:yes gene_type:complete